MTSTTRAPAGRLGRSALAALLLCGAAGAAMAAPAAKGPDPRDAKIEMLEQQLQQMNQALDSLRANGGASNERLDQLQAQMNAFAAQLADMKGATEAAQADIITLKAPPAGNAVTPSLPNGRPSFATADGRFTANLHSVMQFDTTQYFQDSPGSLNTDLRRSGSGAGEAAHARDLNSGTNFRRARLGLDGKVFGFIDYGVLYEFGGSGAEDAGHIHEMWLQYSPPQLKPYNAKIKVGAFEPVIGMEASVSTGSMAFMERPGPAEVARNVAAGDSRSAIQFYGNGNVGEGGDQGISTYWMGSTALTGNTVSTLNSTGGFASQPFDEQKAWIGRFAVAPHMGTDWLVHLGVSGQYVFRPNDTGGPDVAATSRYTAQFRDRIESRTDGTRFVDTGSIPAKDDWVVGLEAGFQMHNFYAEGEWFRYGIDRIAQPTIPNPRFTGWYLEGSYVLTGESRVYNKANGAFDGPVVAFPFNPMSGQWGAWEFAARYSDLNLNFHQGVTATDATTLAAAGGIRGGEQKIWTVGMNWYWNQTVRFMLNYEHVNINRLAPTANFGGGVYPIGSQIGQTVNVISVRSQLQF